MGESVQVGVVSSTPGGDSNTYNLFDSTVTFKNGQGSSSGLRVHDISRIEITVVNSQAGTIRSYRSIDKGTNWDQFGGDISVAANPATDINGPYDFLVDPHADVKIDWVNGGVAQATWRPGVILIRGDRPAAV